MDAGTPTGWSVMMILVTRQNVYDDERFFTLYQAIRDAQAGINEAVEQPALRALLPPLAGARVVDLVCGDGQLSRELAAHCAVSVLDIDPSERMLALATQRTSDDRVKYLRRFAEDDELPTDCGGCVAKASKWPELS